MKKSIIVKISLLLLSFLTIALAGCKNTSSLLPFVSELRCNVYEGESENYHLKGYYGYKETPYLNDAKVSDIR